MGQYLDKIDETLHDNILYATSSTGKCPTLTWHGDVLSLFDLYDLKGYKLS